MDQSFDQRLDEIFGDAQESFDEKFHRRKDYIQKSRNKNKINNY